MNNKRDSLFDNFVTTYFDNLWTNSGYLDLMGKNLDLFFNAKKQWNKNMENLLNLLQLPNQTMQQKILHSLNTLIAEYRFENEEMKERIGQLEKEIKELKAKSVKTK